MCLSRAEVKVSHVERLNLSRGNVLVCHVLVYHVVSRQSVIWKGVSLSCGNVFVSVI